MIKVLILEDEVKAAQALKRTLQSLSMPLQPVASLQSVEEATDWLSNNTLPDLLLADIKLADGLAFDLIQQLSLDIPVIFCTAYDKYTLEAFNNNGVDYLLKPITACHLEQSIQRLFRFGEWTQRLASRDAQYVSSLTVHQGNKIIPISANDMYYLYLINGIIHIRTKTGKYILNEPLDQLVSKLDPYDFYRANRQVLLHRQSISTIETLPARKLQVVLKPTGNQQVVISKAKASHFLHWLEGERVNLLHNNTK